MSMSFVTAATLRPQLAFAIGRRFGTAVERNRARRRLRAAFAAGWGRTPGPAGAYLLSGSRSLLSVEFGSLVAAVETCLAELADRCSPASGGAGRGERLAVPDRRQRVRS
jgi:ribonuclease P protein component